MEDKENSPMNTEEPVERKNLNWMNIRFENRSSI